jgi:aspartate racemase
MKKIGILGGIGPEATILYYRKLTEQFKTVTQSNSHPHVVINSVDLNQINIFIANNEMQKMALYLASEVKSLKDAGASIVAIASNTPHIVFDDIEKMSTIPMLSIVAATAKKAAVLNLKKLGLLGTKFTMESSFYQTVFERYSIEIITPNLEDQSYIVNKYATELTHGIANGETRIGFKAIINKMVSDHQLDGMIVGCTEFPLVIAPKDYPNIQLLDTVAIHIDAILEQYCNEQ